MSDRQLRRSCVQGAPCHECFCLLDSAFPAALQLGSPSQWLIVCFSEWLVVLSLVLEFSLFYSSCVGRGVVEFLGLVSLKKLANTYFFSSSNKTCSKVFAILSKKKRQILVMPQYLHIYYTKLVPL